MQLLVDCLGPGPDAGSFQRGTRIQRRIRERVLEILADHGRLGDHLAVGDQHGYNALRIDGEELRAKLLTAEDVDVVPRPLETLLGERETDFGRARGRPVVVELEHCRASLGHELAPRPRGSQCWRFVVASMRPGISRRR